MRATDATTAGVCGALIGLASVALSACTPRPAACARACDAPFVCASNECVAPGAIPAIEARDRLGDPQVRRVVVAPSAVVRLAPGDTSGEVPPVAILARERDARAILLLRFPLDLPPGTTIVEAHVLLFRATAVDSDPTPVTLHAVRVAEGWDAGSITWGRAPRLDDLHLPSTTIDDARSLVRLDVRPLVRGWRIHAPEDQGIAVVADRSSATGMAFALADGYGAREPTLPLPVHAPGPPTIFTGPDAVASGGERTAPQGPRLELYVKP
jgi:hypothetical protein